MDTLVLDEVVQIAEPNLVSAEFANRINYLEEQAKTLQESMRYAGSLQRSILPNERIFQNVFSDAFVIFQPKDIISGDFYWIFQHHDEVYFAVGDCTGHGVPGAMVNIAGNALLRQIIRLEGLSDPAKIVELLDQELTSLFNEHLTEGTTRDGMDLVFCKFNLSQMKGSFCGAGRPMILIRNGQLVEFKKGLDSIGHTSKESKEYETIHFGLEKGDQFYLFSDGYTDQFGGENVKKFNRQRFRNLLSSITDFDLEKQKSELIFHYNNWKGKQEQVDDICVVGIRI
ncbi:PP2C family protein-serine/threonine phosphatase [Fluviicola taffensis]|uniref:Protein serine/threonine phosphatase n=1 Tax=Fluviicola taffensis (strain DSM 16823 / NCIMB 13979 / RW262) TaxID=755732 RepID=F2IG00_FLUTR|nr:SpoIIE family protein phosphatase [Fluviicola taffensis]AEA43621.1 protein serine/threonine phosphatase [Fluviicola taffensis DSM 16823]